MSPTVMHSWRAEDFPGNRVEFTFTVTPADVDPGVLGEWIDLGAPSIVSAVFNVQGLTDPEYLDTRLRGLVAYNSSATPAATPDAGVADGTEQYNVAGAPYVLSASEYEQRALVVIPRWCYIAVAAPAAPANTHTATVAVTLAI